MWRIEDELHAESAGDYATQESALEELRRRSALAWDVEPNVAPCTNWRKCGRRYEVVEYDTKERPWREVQRFHVLDISSGGINWIEPFAQVSQIKKG